MSTKPPGVDTPLVTTDLAALGRIPFDSLLSDEDVEKFEAQQPEWGVQRRVTLITLARTRQQLIDGFGDGDGQDMLFEMIDHIKDYEKHCKDLVEMASIAAARMIAVAAACIEQGGEQ